MKKKHQSSSKFVISSLIIINLSSLASLCRANEHQYQNQDQNTYSHSLQQLADMIPRLRHRNFNTGPDPSPQAVTILSDSQNQALPVESGGESISHNQESDNQAILGASLNSNINNHNHNHNGESSLRDQSAESDMDEGLGRELGDISQPEVAANNQHEMSDHSSNAFMDEHKSRVQGMQDLFERRFLGNPHQLTSSQELSPMSINLDSVNGMSSPFQVTPFTVPNHDPSQQMAPIAKPQMSNADHIDQGISPALPFALGPLPQLLGFQNQPFDGPQRGDQSAHSNYHTAMPVAETDQSTNQKTWPKIFRFTDGRINLSDFEKQKKIRLSSKNHHGTENHIESAPIMFDGRQLKRKSFLILHGGIFSK